jgi:predicted nucleic acid-binding protein
VSLPDRGPVVLDTGIFSSELVRTGSALADAYRPLIDGRPFLVSFATEAEVRFGATLAGWGQARTRRLEQRLARAAVIWPGPDLVAAYVTLRVWCIQNGHGLGQKDHEADRWIAATAVRFGVPLVTHDAVFRGVDGLELITTLTEPA